MRKMTNSMWIRRVSPLTLAGALVLPLAVQSADAAQKAAVPSAAQKVTEKGKQDKQEFIDRCEKERMAALNLAAEGDYNNAVVRLEAVAKILGSTTGDLAAARRNAIVNDIASIKNIWSSSLMNEAQNFAKEGKYLEAVAKAQAAELLTPDQKYITNLISECQKLENGRKFRSETQTDKVLSDYEESRKQIAIDLREAQLFIRNKRYESACIRLERVLLVDPFNVQAIQLLSQTYNKLFQYGNDRSRETYRNENVRSVWEWIETPAAVGVDHTSNTGKVRQTSDINLLTRLDRIVFPKVQMNGLPMAQVISYLNNKSREYDQDKIGITIIDKMSRKDKKRRITFEMGTMTLADILRYLSMETNIPYTLSGDRVIFGSVDNMTTEYFPIRGEIIAEIVDSLTTRPTSSGMKGPEEGGGDDAEEEEPATVDNSAEVSSGTAEAAPAAASEKLDPKQVNAALKKYFEERYIQFGEGSNIVYSQRGERLMVRNTRENLRRIDALLNQLNELNQPMIMVETKLIELTDTNLNELGFEWMFSASSKSSGWKSRTSSPLRNDGFKVLDNLKIFPNFGEKLFGSDLNVDLSLSINAVAQNRRAEVLASPRILAESGAKKPSMIKMTEKTYFVTEWEQPDVETDGLNLSVDSTAPEWDDEAQDLGVTFSVQPTVQSDNYTITLNNINPVFLTHIGDYSNPVTYGLTAYDPEGKLIREQNFSVDMRMPEISKREILTNITLYDGETVLIGGMVDNEKTTRNDKWPILGDIPLIGRLFQDKQSNVTNRTMLIFITARLIKPDGTPLRSVRDRGLIDFKR